MEAIKLRIEFTFFTKLDRSERLWESASARVTDDCSLGPHDQWRFKKKSRFSQDDIFLNWVAWIEYRCHCFQYLFKKLWGRRQSIRFECFFPYGYLWQFLRRCPLKVRTWDQSYYKTSALNYISLPLSQVPIQHFVWNQHCSKCEIRLSQHRKIANPLPHYHLTPPSLPNKALQASGFSWYLGTIPANLIP